MPKLEEVFRLSGIPTYTFVEPLRYGEIKVSIRTPGRCLVVEGPSGIGKTTTIAKALADLKLEDDVLSLSARRPADVEIIEALPELGDLGTVIVDDFHRLPEPMKARLSDFMKLLADTANEKSKLILIGINKAGHQLVKFAHDLGMRIDVFRLEANPIEKIGELIALGEKALNIDISEKHKIAERAQGSFQIAQLLCHKVCTLSGILETCPEKRVVDVPLEVAIEDVMVDLSRQFRDVAVDFARGSKLRREGRAPYLHILRWLADSNEWSLDLSDALRIHQEQRGSVGQVIDKGYLAALLKAEPLSDYFHYEPSTAILSVEDPKLIFYLKNLVWRAFTREVGFPSDVFQHRYDFALSFAGANREHAERLFDILSEREVAVFYDRNEQHRIMAQNVETYLAPIYRSEAKYVVPFLSPDFPTRIWTKFESDNFRQRFGENAVIPIRYSTARPGFFSDDQKYGGMGFDPNGDVEAQLQEIADMLCKKLVEERRDGAVIEPQGTED
jgi:hypothetical protein